MRWMKETGGKKCEMRRIEKISKRDEKERLKLFMVCGTGTV